MKKTGLKKCQCSKCDCDNKTTSGICRNCNNDIHSDMSYLDIILKEREELTPKEGYNIVTIDEYGSIGEKLELHGSADTYAEAVMKAKQIGVVGETVFIYGTRDAEKKEKPKK